MKMFGLLLAVALLVMPAAAAEVASGEVYCFSPGDFSEEELAGICVAGVPENGTVQLGDRVIRPGDLLTAEQIGAMTFAPHATETDRSGVLTYLGVYADRVEPAKGLTISVLGRQDQAPVAEDSAMETYKNLPNEDRLKVHDPEGQPLTYTITRQPRRGTVTVAEDGSFVYEPKKNKVGVDSFAYTAQDPAGNVSREATVIVTILKPSQAQQYTDTLGDSCRFAAEWMKNTGIFTAEQVSGVNRFQPEKTVSRGEFLTMLVSALELEVNEEAVTTATADAAPWLRPYLAAALRCGLTAGLPDGTVSDAEGAITGAEAAVMIHNALDLAVSLQGEAGEDVPAWAADAVTTLAENGVDLDAAAPLTRADAARSLYRTVRLAQNAPGTQMLNWAQ